MVDPGSVRVLVVDNDPDFAELAAEMLERESDGLTVEVETSASEGLDRLAERDVDCVVSDYDMPDMDGIEFLEAVRDEYPDLPFILYTGAGSEDVASDAVSAGVTDYFQKQGETEQYELLANRIHNAVEGHRADRARQRNLEAIESAQEGISILDENGEFVYVNEQYADLYGYDPAEMVGEHWELIYPDEEIAKTRQEVLPSVDEDGYWHGETTGLRADGTTFPEDHVVSRTDRGNLVCTVRDLSDQREYETELRMKTRAMDEAPVGITISDPSRDDNPLIYVNDRFEELTGYDEEEILGKNCRFLQGEDTDPERVAAMREAIDAGEPVTVELRNYREDGTEFWNRVRIMPLTDDDGTVWRWVGFQEDITDRKEDERRLKRQNERLDELTSVVSHDLRNPLNVATGRLELAQRECDSDYLDDVADAHDRIESLIDDLLTLAREGEQVVETDAVDLAGVIQGCWRNVETTDATLVVEADRTIRADPSRLKRLLENLFRNAVEHAGDDVTVTVGDLDDGFYVADDGPGIPEDERDRVFEAGYSTTDTGTGFGLNIVGEIAKAHDWDVTVRDSEAGGARFEITCVTVEDDQQPPVPDDDHSSANRRET
ncbi:MAG: PAS domain-containing protein [Haloarculaceae archaeon]